MKQEPVNLSPEVSQVYEVGAAMVVLLVCPDAKSQFRRADLYASLCAKAFSTLHSSDPDNAEPIAVRPQHVFRGAKLIDQHRYGLR
jgi:hypothetical protein